jgi:uncharacterized protein with HEPN domain
MPLSGPQRDHPTNPHALHTIDLSRIWLLIERDMPLLKAACQDALQALSLGKPPG